MRLQIVVTYNPDWLGRLMRRYGHTWNHMCLRYYRETPGSSWRTIESAMVGIKERSWEEFIAPKTEYQALQVRDDLPESTKREIVAYAWGNVGKPYAFHWLFTFGWRVLRERLFSRLSVLTYPAHLCSSLVYDCFRYAGVDLLPNQAGVLVTPDELATSPLLQRIDISNV